MIETIHPCFTRDLISYPPAPIIAGIELVAIGVMNAVREPAVIRMISPVGFAPIAWQASRQMGTKIFITA